MTITSIVQMSLRSMRANKARTLLTILGMVIGIAAVIVVFSAGEGIKGLIIGQVESFGTNFIQAEVRVPSSKTGNAKEAQSGQAIAQGVQVTTMKLEDLDKIKRLPNITDGYAMVQAQEQASYGSELRRIFMLGVNASFINIDKTEVAEGRFFSDEEDKSLAQVIVLGSGAKEKLFGDVNAVGKSIRLRKAKYEVVGVMKERGAAGFVNFDDWAYVPIRTTQKKIMGIDYVFSIVAKAKDQARAEETADEMRQILREQHDITDPIKDDFRVTTSAELMDTLGTVTSAITLLLLALVSVSLLVGGVGIMNIMYVVVTERTMEIGLRKAVGAHYGDIMKQFLVEAVIITVLGGIVGVVIGIGMSALLAWMANNVFNISWKFIIPLKAFVVSIGFSVFFGLVFGVYPARKAARLDPIQALISE